MSRSTVMREVVIERFGDKIIGSTLEDVTPEEITEAKRIYHMTGHCDHSLIEDEQGWLYDLRYCAVCGTGLGTV